MLAVLNFCSKDRDMALRLLKWIRELGDVKRHDLMLLTGVATMAGGLSQELEMLAREMFGNVIMRVTDTQDERGWPMSANNAWRDTVFFMRMRIGRSWLWLEPDCVPMTPDWLDRIEAEYDRAKKPFMGAEIMNPQHRMSGPGVYHKYVTEFTRKLASLPDKVPFDQFFAPDIVPNCHFTPLIQNVWNVEFGKPETIPAFPTQEEMKLIDPQAVLFHRNKDGTLIDRLRERSPVRVATAPASTASTSTQDADALQRRIRELEAQILQNQKLVAMSPMEERLAVEKYMAIVDHPLRNRTGKPKRTPAEKAVINARMAKARAGRKKVVA